MDSVRIDKIVEVSKVVGKSCGFGVWKRPVLESVGASNSFL